MPDPHQDRGVGLKAMVVDGDGDFGVGQLGEGVLIADRAHLQYFDWKRSVKLGIGNADPWFADLDIVAKLEVAGLSGSAAQWLGSPPWPLPSTDPHGRRSPPAPGVRATCSPSNRTGCDSRSPLGSKSLPPQPASIRHASRHPANPADFLAKMFTTRYLSSVGGLDLSPLAKPLKTRAMRFMVTRAERTATTQIRQLRVPRRPQ